MRKILLLSIILGLPMRFDEIIKYTKLQKFLVERSFYHL